jgi:hypothetical protein
MESRKRNPQPATDDEAGKSNKKQRHQSVPPTLYSSASPTPSFA